MESDLLQSVFFCTPRNHAAVQHSSCFVLLRFLPVQHRDQVLRRGPPSLLLRLI